MKKNLVFLVIFASIPFLPLVNAQEVSVADSAKQKQVQVTIDLQGNVHVKHIVESSNSPKQIELINGVVSNLSVLDEDGNEQQHAVIGENQELLILPSQNETVVEYNLGEALKLEDGFWKWDFRYLERTSFILPEELDLVFANERGVYLDERKGIMCHGCQMLLEYSFDEPKLVQDVKWEDKEFPVQLRTMAKVSEFKFDQPSKSIRFNVNGQDEFVTTIIPLELLWEPYEVYLGDNQIFTHKINNNGTHVSLNFRPESSGQITIIGTTVIPEFPLFAPLAVGFGMIMIIPFLKKFNLR